ncbi:MAG TPA: anti-sigma factor [Anaerolineales bacterium]|nr:anti-sigma factor [Anaerolineales bacterium]
MMEEMHVLESLPAYALGSLDASEATMVAQHLAGCHICRRELQAFQEVAGQIALAAPQAELSGDIKPRLMERIKSLNQRQARPEWWRFTGRLMPIEAIAGLILIATLAVSNLLLWQRLNQMEVLAGPLGMRAITLQNTDAAPTASGFVIISADGQDGVLVVDELPELDAQREYQLWLVRNGSNTSASVFSVDESGYRGMRIESPQSLLAYSSVFVTIEPVGGSVEPNGEQVLRGSLFNP